VYHVQVKGALLAAAALGTVLLSVVGCSGDNSMVPSQTSATPGLSEGGRGCAATFTPHPSAERADSPLQPTAGASGSSAAVAATPPATVRARTPSAPEPRGTPIAGEVDLTGQVADDIPGTLIAVGAVITSVVDPDTKPRDVYAIYLTAGDAFVVEFHGHSALQCPACYMEYSLNLLNPDSKSFVHDRFSGSEICAGTYHECRVEFRPAVSGVYYLAVVAKEPLTRYKIRVDPCPESECADPTLP